MVPRPNALRLSLYQARGGQRHADLLADADSPSNRTIRGMIGSGGVAAPPTDLGRAPAGGATVRTMELAMQQLFVYDPATPEFRSTIYDD